MSSANFKPKRTAAASCGFLATADSTAFLFIFAASLSERRRYRGARRLCVRVSLRRVATARRSPQPRLQARRISLRSEGHSMLSSYYFLPARRYASAGLCDSDVSVRLSVRRTPVLCLAERKQDREMYTI